MREVEGDHVPGRNSVTSYAFPWTITQQESRELCFATSSPESAPASGLLPLSLLILNYRDREAEVVSLDQGLLPGDPGGGARWE